jgi:hypothetical protein
MDTMIRSMAICEAVVTALNDGASTITVQLQNDGTADVIAESGSTFMATFGRYCVPDSDSPGNCVDAYDAPDAPRLHIAA